MRLEYNTTFITFHGVYSTPRHVVASGRRDQEHLNTQHPLSGSRNYYH